MRLFVCFLLVYLIDLCCSCLYNFEIIFSIFVKIQKYLVIGTGQKDACVQLINFWNVTQFFPMPKFPNQTFLEVGKSFFLEVGNSSFLEVGKYSFLEVGKSSAVYVCFASPTH